MLKESEGKNLETIEDFMDEELRKKWSGMGLVSGERPVIIWVDKESGLLPLIKITARELYRIKMGGFPKSHHYGILAEPFRSGVEDLTADKSIFVVAYNIIEELFTGNSKGKKSENELNEKGKLFVSKLNSVYAQKGGFIIIECPFEEIIDVSSSRKSILPIHYKKFKEKIHNDSFKEIFIPHAQFSINEKKFSDIVGMKPYLLTYGQIDKYYQNELEYLAAHPKYAPFVKPSDGEESLLHYALKVFTYRYLREKRKIDAENIETEYPIKEGEYIPDISVGRGSTIYEVYEIEALYGKGFTIGRNLYEKVEKAWQNGIRHVHFIFSPLHYFIFGKEILSYLGEIKKELRDMNIYVDIPVFMNEKFMIMPVHSSPFTRKLGL